MNVARSGEPLKLDIRKVVWGWCARADGGRASFGGFQTRKVGGSEEGEVREGGEGWGVRMGWCRGVRTFQIRKVVWGWCARADVRGGRAAIGAVGGR